MNKWIAEFDLEDGDTMPEHMDLEYKGARIDFHCRPLDQEPTTKNDLGVDCISREQAINAVNMCSNSETILNLQQLPSITPQEPVKKLEEQIKQLQNRCHALTHGQICVFCLYDCEHKAESEDKE